LPTTVWLNANDVAPSLVSYPYARLVQRRLCETVSTASGLLVLRTDFVTMPKPQKNQVLLIYSVEFPKASSARLYTAFPIQQGFQDSFFAAGNLGEAMPIRSRFNSYIPGVTGQSLIGRRNECAVPQRVATKR